MLRLLPVGRSMLRLRALPRVGPLSAWRSAWRPFSTEREPPKVEPQQEIDTLHPDFKEPASIFQLPRSTIRSAAVMAVSQFIITSGFGVIIPVLPAFADEIGLGALGIGAIISAPSGVRVLLNLRMGLWADQVGRRPLMILGTLASALAGFGTAFATSFATMIPFRLFAGLGSSASIVGATAFMADLTERTPHHRAKLLGMQQAMVGLSFIGGPAIGGWLAEQYGARTAFYVVGVSCALCSLGYSFLPETLKMKRPWTLSGRNTVDNGHSSVVDGAILTKLRNDETLRKASEQINNEQITSQSNRERVVPVTAVGVVANSTHSEKRSDDVEPLEWSRLLRNPTQQAVLIMTSALACCYSVQLAVIPLHAASVWSATPGQLGIMFSIASASGLIGAPLGGWIADRFGRKTAVAVPGFFAVLTSFALPFATTQDTFTAVLVFMSLSTSMLNPGLSALAADIAPSAHRAASLSLSRQASDIAFTLFPLALGGLAALYSPHVAMLTSGCTIFCGWAYFLLRAKNLVVK